MLLERHITRVRRGSPAVAVVIVSRLKWMAHANEDVGLLENPLEKHKRVVEDDGIARATVLGVASAGRLGRGEREREREGEREFKERQGRHKIVRKKVLVSKRRAGCAKRVGLWHCIRYIYTFFHAQATARAMYKKARADGNALLNPFALVPPSKHFRRARARCAARETVSPTTCPALVECVRVCV